MNHNYQRDISGCGLTGVISRKKKLISGSEIIKSICLMNDRGNGLGAGFAAYGIYPDFEDFYAFHIMYDDPSIRLTVEEYLKANFRMEKIEEIPTRPVKAIAISPLLVRYFVKPLKERMAGDVGEDDFVVNQLQRMDVDPAGKEAVVVGPDRRPVARLLAVQLGHYQRRFGAMPFDETMDLLESKGLDEAQAGQVADGLEILAMALATIKDDAPAPPAH